MNKNNRNNASIEQSNKRTIPLLSHISLHTTVLVFFHGYQLQCRKTREWLKEEKFKVQIGIYYSEENKLFKVKNRYQLQ